MRGVGWEIYFKDPKLEVSLTRIRFLMCGWLVTLKKSVFSESPVHKSLVAGRNVKMNN